MAEITSSKGRQVEGSGPSGHVNRSCQGCRARKVKCKPVENSQTGKCARCEKMNLSCVYLAPQPKRRRKRTDVRVAELEKELRSLRKRLEGQPHGEARASSAPATTLESAADEIALLQLASNSKQDESTSELESSGSQLGANWRKSTPDDDESDEIEVDDATAELLYTKFKMDLLPTAPLVSFPNEMSATEMRRRRPILFQAILAASSECLYPPLGQALSQKVERLYAQVVVIEGQKSLELVQSLLLSAMWYRPPNRFTGLKFTMYAHMAANMALDIHLGKKSSASKFEYSGKDELDEFDASRTLVSCYTLCSSMAFSLRRSPMLQYSGWIQNCAQDLERSPNSIDQQLLASFKLQHIVEGAFTALGLFGVANGSFADLRDTKTQNLLKSYDRQLENWKQVHLTSAFKTLHVHFYYTRASIHELALYPEHSQNEFEPPYLMRSKPIAPSFHVETNPAFAHSLYVLIECSQAILEFFATLSTVQLRSVPVTVFSRVFYAMIVLTKLMICTRTPESRIGKMIDSSSIKLSEYMFTTIHNLEEAAGTELFVVPATFLTIFNRLAAWYHRQQYRSPGAIPEDNMTPMKVLYQSGKPTHPVVSPENEIPIPDYEAAASSQSIDQFQGATAPLSLPPLQQDHLPTLDQDFLSQLGVPPNTLPPKAWLVGLSAGGGEIPYTAAGAVGDVGLTDANLNLFDPQTWNFGLAEEAPMLLFEDDTTNVPNGSGWYTSGEGL